MLETFSIESSKPVNTPINPGTNLTKGAKEGRHLLYLSTKTRPDIAYAVNDVARFCGDPTEEYRIAVKRIMGYLSGTRDMGLLYIGNEETTTFVGYSDANWAGDLDDRKSTSVYVFQISNAAISWRSKKQSRVALSTAEAKYMHGISRRNAGSSMAPTTFN